MGNSFGCSASGERLVSAARDGDIVEAKMLLECNPCLSRYSTFGGLNSPLHFAAAKGHNEIVLLLIDNGADVNSRNYCGQTPLMQACRYGHWEVVQSLILFRCNVTREESLSGRTALHFAALNGHARSLRLVVADLLPTSLFETCNSSESERGDISQQAELFYQRALEKFVNKAADGGVTALHAAALNGHFDCVQLLLDIHADVSATTSTYGTAIDFIGAGSTPLHYAACGGDAKCCQILLARGASRMALNCNGWLPADVARFWRRHWIEPLLAPNSDASIPCFPHSNYLSLPLSSILNIAREYGLQCTASADTCAICLERACNVAAKECGHELCVKCALYLCSSIGTNSETPNPRGSIPCPLCRQGVTSFVKLPTSPSKEIKLPWTTRLCTPCKLHPRDPALPDTDCPVPCAPFSSMPFSICRCNDVPCSPHVLQQLYDGPSSPSLVASVSARKSEASRPDKARCPNMFWGRSYSREHLCNSEIST